MASGKFETFSQLLLNRLLAASPWIIPGTFFPALFTVSPSVSSLGRLHARDGGQRRRQLAAHRWSDDDDRERRRVYLPDRCGRLERGGQHGGRWTMGLVGRRGSLLVGSCGSKSISPQRQYGALPHRRLDGSRAIK
jgi:hypothetical protein